MRRAVAPGLALVAFLSGAAWAMGPDIGALRRLHAEPERQVTPPETAAPPEQRAEPPLRAQLELPEILSEEDVGLYRRIFMLQEEARWELADAVAERLTDRRLMGYVQAQRYLHVSYRSSYAELRRWLDEYAELPIAIEIHALAQRKRPRGAANPRRPVGTVDPEDLDEDARADLPRPRWSRAQARQARRYRRMIYRNLQRDRLTITGRFLARNDVGRLFGPVRIDDMRADLALRWFQLGRIERAHDIARSAADRSGDLVPQAHWVAGITAWALERYDPAATHFQRVADAGVAENRERAAGAYWAARAHLARDDARQAEAWLRRASTYPRTFYGVLGRQRLGMEQDYHWEPAEADPAVLAQLTSSEAGQRVFALIQVRRYADAGRELLRLYYRGGERNAATFVALADAGNMPALGYRIGVRAYARSGAKLDTGLYPIPAWRPEDGFRLDRALIYAMIRQESSFNTRARSHAGARGLMQLMPATASMVARDRSLRRRHAARLYHPEFNMELGQRFLRYLLDRPAIRGNLFFAIAAYNAGEGNLNDWEMRSDPLLFVESIPLRETRLYVKRVMYNYWAYRQRLGQETPSLAAVTAGRWPHYQPQDQTQ